MTAAPHRFDPEALFAALHDGGVAYILIGGIAATLHGSPLRTGDSDICPADDPANLQRLADVLTRLGARIRTDRDAVDLPVSAGLLASAELWNLSTPHGDLDIAFRPAGTDGYDDLDRHAVTYDLGGIEVRVASLEDVIRSKAAADRPKDREQLPYLRALLDEQG